MYATSKRSLFASSRARRRFKDIYFSWRRTRPSAFFRAVVYRELALPLYDSLSHTQITNDRRRQIMNSSHSSRSACYLYKNKFIILIPFAPLSVLRVIVAFGNLHSSPTAGNLGCGSSRPTIETDDRSYIAPAPATLC